MGEINWNNIIIDDTMLGVTAMNDPDYDDIKIKIDYKEYDEDHFIAIFSSRGKNLGFTFVLFEFSSLMRNLGFPNDILQKNDENGFVFPNLVNKEVLTYEVEKFIARHNLEPLNRCIKRE